MRLRRVVQILLFASPSPVELLLGLSFVAVGIWYAVHRHAAWICGQGTCIVPCLILAAIWVGIGLGMVFSCVAGAEGSIRWFVLAAAVYAIWYTLMQIMSPGPCNGPSVFPFLAVFAGWVFVRIRW